MKEEFSELFGDLRTYFTPEDGSCLMKKTTATMVTKKKVLTTVMTPQHNNQSHGRNEDGGIGDERQVCI